VEEERISPFLLNLCNQIKPAFEKPQSTIRASAAHLFESLTRFGNAEQVRDAFLDQIHINLPSIILHINDEDYDVRKSFRKLLFTIAPLLHYELQQLLSTSYIFNVDSDGDYNEFLRMHLSKLLVKVFPERINPYIETSINPYFTSQWDQIKGNAAFFVATLMYNVPEEVREDLSINVGFISRELVQLLQERSPNVRIQASAAISLLYSY